MKLALNGYAVVASHKVIEQKYTALRQHHKALEQLVGKEEANSIVIDTYMRVIG